MLSCLATVWNTTFSAIKILRLFAVWVLLLPSYNEWLSQKFNLCSMTKSGLQLRTCCRNGELRTDATWLGNCGKRTNKNNFHYNDRNAKFRNEEIIVHFIQENCLLREERQPKRLTHAPDSESKGPLVQVVAVLSRTFSLIVYSQW